MLAAILLASLHCCKQLEHLGRIEAFSSAEEVVATVSREPWLLQNPNPGLSTLLRLPNLLD